MKLSKQDKEQLLELAKSKNIYLEGNIIKLIEGDDPEFEQYLKDATEKDRESRRKRLEITKKIQTQNSELSKLNEENSKMMQDLEQTLKNVEESKKQIESQNNELLQWREDNEKMQEELKDAVKKSEVARLEAEQAKENAENDLDIMQKKTQFELIGTIVKVSLFVILGVGVITTGMYVMAIMSGVDTSVIGSTWSNIIGILLTNAFSIIGTIMGVKYASEKN
jgi:predicted RNase H-like nuclease (RuvC/YqgF family)